MKLLKNNILLAEASEMDIEELINLQIKMALETENLKLNSDIVRKGIKAVFQDKSKGKYYKITADGKVLGCMFNTYEWSEWRNAYLIWIQSLYILPEYRSQGLFKAVYEYLQNLVKSSNTYKGIRLYVSKENPKAIQVYKSLSMDNYRYDFFEWLN